jgi:hypothetical protein
METVHIAALPEAEWKRLLAGQEETAKLQKELKTAATGSNSVVPYITAMEFMQAVRIGRTKFDKLVSQNKVKAMKKDGKIYVPIGEVERHFEGKIT